MSEKNITSVKNLYREMILAIKGDSKKYKWLLSECLDQSNLCKIKREQSNIKPIALNTFKKYADIHIEGGFDRVNELRGTLKKRYLESVRTSKNIDKKQADDDKVKLDEAVRARAILIRAYNDLNSICLDAISNSPKYQYDYEQHVKLYRSYFCLEAANNNEKTTL
jgi:hypothetical protein